MRGPSRQKRKNISEENSKKGRKADRLQRENRGKTVNRDGTGKEPKLKGKKRLVQPGAEKEKDFTQSKP